jgi:hypothetical protein
MAAFFWRGFLGSVRHEGLSSLGLMKLYSMRLKAHEHPGSKRL